MVIPQKYLDDNERRKWTDQGKDDLDMQFKDRELASVLKHRETNWTNYPDHVLSTKPKPINIVLIGMGGSGKSSLGNLLLDKCDEQVFKTGNSIARETKQCKVQTSEFSKEKQAVQITDTPGYFFLAETSWPNYFLAMLGLRTDRNKEHKKLVVETAKQQKGGIDCLIVVMNLTDQRFREEEIKIMTDLKMLNTNSMNYCMVVGSYGNTQFRKTGIKELFKEFEKSEPMKMLLTKINKRVVITEATGNEGDNALPGLDTPCRKEKEQAREMVMNMVGKVIADNKKAGISPVYTREAIEADMEKCFPALSKVHTASGEKTMEELCIGDEILVIEADGLLQYQPIIMFSHCSADLQASFIAIHTSCGKVLRLSAGHLLHVKKHGELLAAREVQVGDVVFTADGGEVGDMKESHVTDITTELLTGIYCPHTTGGSILVDGVLASCYTDMLSPVVAHAAMFPVRMLYRILPDGWFNWILPYDKRSGMPCIVECFRSIMMLLIE